MCIVSNTCVHDRRLESGGAWPVTLSLVNELDSVSSNGTPAWDSARYLREILKAPV